jgi:hypothetical protein
MHADKLKFGQIRTDYLLKYGNFLMPEKQQKKGMDDENYFTE